VLPVAVATCRTGMTSVCLSDIGNELESANPCAVASQTRLEAGMQKGQEVLISESFMPHEEVVSTTVSIHGRIGLSRARCPRKLETETGYKDSSRTASHISIAPES
jgi:hypothetical protein